MRWAESEGGALITCGAFDVIDLEPSPGTYPPFERVVPDPAKCQPFYLNAPAWQAALPALVPIARENSNRITVEIEGARAVLSARSEGLGEVSADVEVAGGAVGARFAINVRYLALALSHVQNVFLTPSGEVLTAEEARLRRAETGNAFAALPAWFVARASDLFLLFWREDA